MKLKKTESICDRCDGRGEVSQEFDCPPSDWKYGLTEMVFCPKCKGHKKLDWIEMITGSSKPEPLPF